MPRRRQETPLELDGGALTALVAQTMSRLAPFLDSLPSQPTNRLEGSHRLARALVEPMPEEGAPYGRILGQLFERVLPVSLNPASPGYLGYIPGGGLPSVALADLIADVVNRYTGLWMPAPGLVQLEQNVIRWLADLAGYPAGAAGLLTSGGSLANLGGVVAAREALLPRDFLCGRIYTSTEAHHSVLKAARVAGFPADAVRALPTDARFRLDLGALRAAVAEDRAAGLRPFLVAAQAGSTPVGAVDDLEALADLCASEGMWLHVDAAYGGAFLLTARGQEVLRGIGRADSIALDPHKGLFLPYGTGALLARDRERLAAAFRVSASYLPASQTDSDRWDFADFGPELSRPARGLRVWLPLKLHGARAFREALDEKLDLAREAALRVAALPELRLLNQPALSLFAFRAEPARLPPAEWDAFNRRVLSRVVQRQRVLLTGVTVFDPARGEPVFAIRVCVLSFRTHADRIDALLEDLAAALADPRG